MKCLLCNQRKGKRPCPAKEALICPQCCGEKRVLEIDCPESCEYLRVGRSHELAQERSRHGRSSDPAKQMRYQRVVSQFRDFIAHVEYFFGDERRSSRSLLDKDVADALDLVLETLRTEHKGILYDHVSSNLRVDGMRRRLQQIVEYHRSSRTDDHEAELISSPVDRQHMTVQDSIESLEMLRDVVSSHMESGNGPQSYVNFLARLFPREGKVQDSASGLIVPG